MIRLTRMDGTPVYLNPDLIEFIEENPDTLVILSNGKSYLFLESAAIAIDRIVRYKARILHLSSLANGKKYLKKCRGERFQRTTKLNAE